MSKLTIVRHYPDGVRRRAYRWMCRTCMDAVTDVWLDTIDHPSAMFMRLTAAMRQLGGQEDG